MSYPVDDMLVVGITSRALFALDEADAVFCNEGIEAYREYQRAHEDEPLAPGTAFPLVRGLLAINEMSDKRLVEVVVISKNNADTAMRVFNSIEHHSLDVTRGAFTDGRDSAPYLRPFCGDLFLSAEESEVLAALNAGFPAALVCPPPESPFAQEQPHEVRIAFDGDAVLFDAESERVHKELGLKAFQEREARLHKEPMNPGPFEPFLRALKRVQDRFPPEASPIRTALVTARNAPAQKRVVNTLRAWGVRLDETFFLGGIEKAGILEVFRPHIFFDDQEAHLLAAQRVAPSAHVVGVPQQMELPGVESGGPDLPEPTELHREVESEQTREAAATRERASERIVRPVQP